MSRRRSYPVRCSVPCGRAPSLASFAAPRLARSVRGSHARFGALSHFCDGRGAWHPDKATRCGRACRIARSEPQCQVRAGSGWRRAHFPGLRVTFMRLNVELSTAPACNLSRERESGPGATARARSDATGPSWLTSSTSARLAPHSPTGAHAERVARTKRSRCTLTLRAPARGTGPPGRLISSVHHPSSPRNASRGTSTGLVPSSEPLLEGPACRPSTSSPSAACASPTSLPSSPPRC